MILKQSTAATVVVGPVLDSSGAAVTTAVTANFSLSKNGTVNALTSETVTHSTNGYYTIALTSSNTDTLGRIEIIVNDSAMSMATHRYNVVSAASYDLIVLSGSLSPAERANIADATAQLNIISTPYGTSTWGRVARDTYLNLATVDVVVNEILTDTADMQPKLATAAEIADAVWDEPLTGATHNVSTSAGRRLRQLGDTVILKDGETVAADNAGVINGTNGLGRIKLQPDVGTVCVGQAVRVTGMVRFIEAYDADTQYATVDAPWCTIPEVGDEYTIFNLRTSLIQRITSAASGTIAFVIAKLWDMIEDVSGYRFTADALEQAPSGGGASALLPCIGVVPVRVDQTMLTAFVGETISVAIVVYQSDGTTPMDLSGKTLEVCFESTSTTDVAVVGSADITVSGDDNNVVTFSYPSAVTGSVANYHWSLRDASAPKTVWQYGTLYVKRAALKDA